jgi:hypothetical protein
MNPAVQPLLEERVSFGRAIPVAVNALLQQAAANAHDFDASERVLLQARALAPTQLEVFIALYKLYFYRGFTERAEQVVLEALHSAAHSGGFDADWRSLVAGSADWRASEGPARVYLYSLKALCFIRLRQRDSHGAAELFAALHRLDPDDQVGTGVLRDLADGLEEVAP